MGVAAPVGLSPAFDGFIIVAPVGGAAEMVSAFSAASPDRLNLSVGKAGLLGLSFLGSGRALLKKRSPVGKSWYRYLRPFVGTERQRTRGG